MPRRQADVCISTSDSSRLSVDAESWLGASGRYPSDNAEVRAEGLLRANRGILKDFQVTTHISRNQGRPYLHFETSSKIGAMPLLSPMSGKPEYGLVISPRFGWEGIGASMAAAGFRVVPELLPLPALPKSDRQVPAWVISSVVLARLQRVLACLNRRFQIEENGLQSPKGTVLWNEYATKQIPSAHPHVVPCRYPDLHKDDSMRSFIHYVLMVHRSALQGQRSASYVVVKLLDLCNSLLMQVSDVTPRMPTKAFIQSSLNSHKNSKVFKEGIESIDWTINERGLAGLEATEGLSWRMEMSEFFEAWCESILEKLAEQSGLRLLTGRQEATRLGIQWTTPGTGSQKSLLPDFVLQGYEKTIVVDAKYKVHAEEINYHGWWKSEEQIKESHRNDMMQVLAYSGLYASGRTIACLLYPCRPETYRSLATRRRLITPAKIQAPRPIDFLLGVVQLGGSSNETITALKEYIQMASY